MNNYHSNFVRKIYKYIKEWENKGYEKGIPNEACERLERLCKVPSYRAICIAIMKNDMTLKSLGFSKPKCELYNELKSIEIRGRK